MAHPKRKISKTRRNKRRTHQKLEVPLLMRCALTGEFHRPHEAYSKNDKLYYKGKLVTDLK